jgi:uncharacterized protein
MFDSPGKLLLGLLTGVVFGILLQKGHVAKHAVIVGQLVFRDWTVAKIMGTAVAVGAVGVHGLVAVGATHLDVKPAELGGILAGAFCFGVGLAVLGYCPGTTVAAAGEGKRDAVAGIAGMLAGAGVFVAAYPAMQRVQHAIADWGKATWPTMTGTSPWPWVIGIALVTALVYAHGRNRRRTTTHGLSEG